MRILWIPHTGWHIPQRARVFCEGLAERHEVHVTDWVADFASLPDYLSVRYIENLTYRARMDGQITVHRIPRFSPALPLGLLRSLNSAVFSSVVAKIIRRHKIDVVVGTFPCKPPKCKRLVFDLFDDNVSYWRYFRSSESYAKEIALTELRYLMESDAVVAASSVLAERARLLGARGPIHLIPNGVDLRLFDRSDRRVMRKELGVDSKWVIGSIGNYEVPGELKNVVDAAKALADEPILFVLAGRGSAMRVAARRAASEGLTNILFRGYIPPSEAPSVIDAFDVGLCSYTKSKMDDARSPMRLLMYAAAGLPTVCTDLEEVRRMKFPNVVLVDDNGASIAAGVKEALSMPRIRPSQVELYDLPRLIDAYDAVLRGGKGRASIRDPLASGV